MRKKESEKLPPKVLCSICSKQYDEHGHDSRPVTTGRCCNKCNDRRVIPAKIRQMREQHAPG